MNFLQITIQDCWCIPRIYVSWKDQTVLATSYHLAGTLLYSITTKDTNHATVRDGLSVLIDPGCTSTVNRSLILILQLPQLTSVYEHGCKRMKHLQLLQLIMKITCKRQSSAKNSPQALSNLLFIHVDINAKMSLQERRYWCFTLSEDTDCYTFG